MIELCIFDLDGTLIDSAPDLEVSANTALEHFGLPKRSLSQIKEGMGKGINHLLKTSIPKEKYTQQLFDDIKKMYVGHYVEHCTDNTIVYDGVLDMLHELQRKGIKMAILTNKPHSFLDKIITELFCGIKFDVVIGQGEYPSKPNPAAVFFILNELGVSSDKSIFIGDSSVDIRTGINSKMRTVGVSWGYRDVDVLKKAGADYIINTAGELLDLF